MLGNTWHEFKADIGRVPGPFEIKGGNGNSTLSSYHSKFRSFTLKDGPQKSFAVSVESSGYAPDSMGYGGPKPSTNRQIGAIDQGWDYKDEKPVAIIADRRDHLELIDHARVDGRSLASLDKEMILHHADPFGYEPQKDSKNRQFFKEHSQVMAELLPSEATANRADLIDSARLIGRKMTKDVSGTFAEDATISLAELGTGAAIHHVAQTGGGIFNILAATSTAAAAKATVATAGVAAPLFLITKQVERAVRVHRMRPTEKTSANLKEKSGAILSEAKQHRNIYLQQIDKMVALLHSKEATDGWAVNRRNILDAWDKTDSGLQNYLSIISRGIAGKSDSVPKEFARSLLTLVAHETKLSLIAEQRLLKDLKYISTTLDRHMQNAYNQAMQQFMNSIKEGIGPKLTVTEARAASPGFREAVQPDPRCDQIFELEYANPRIWQRWKDFTPEDQFATDLDGPRFQRIGPVPTASERIGESFPQKAREEAIPPSGTGSGSKYNVSQARAASPGFKSAFKLDEQIIRDTFKDEEAINTILELERTQNIGGMYKKPNSSNPIWNRWIDLRPDNGDLVIDLNSEERYQRKLELHPQVTKDYPAEGSSSA